VYFVNEKDDLVGLHSVCTSLRPSEKKKKSGKKNEKGKLHFSFLNGEIILKV